MHTPGSTTSPTTSSAKPTGSRETGPIGPVFFVLTFINLFLRVAVYTPTDRSSLPALNYHMIYMFMSTTMRNHLLVALACLAFTGATLAADLRNGKDINELCAGCHGEYGEGGKDGEYPRIAGQPATFIAKQLHLFRDRKLPNMAMLEYVDERQTPDADIEDIAAYLEQLELLKQLPPIDESKEFDPLERLMLAKRTLNIRRAEGDIEKGKKIYNKECRSCHGVDGWGERSKDVPMLAGQYTNYLIRQVDRYRKRIRVHDESDPKELLEEFSDEEIANIFAFLSSVDD